MSAGSVSLRLLLSVAADLLDAADEANHSGDFGTFEIQRQARVVLAAALDREIGLRDIGDDVRLARLERLTEIENAALHVASSRRRGIVTDKKALDRLDAALEASEL